MEPVHAVLFDYGLVLSGPPDPAAWQRMKQVFDAEEKPFHAAYWKHRHDYDRGALNGSAYWRAVAADLAHPVSEEQMSALIHEDTALWTEPNPQMIQWAARLQRVGVKTGILSNIGDAMEHGIRKRCGWISGFEHHTFSHRLGMAKPEPAIYAHAAAGLDVPAAEVLFIDDRDDNVAAAIIAGMQALPYKGHQQFVSEMRAHGFGYLLDV